MKAELISWTPNPLGMIYDTYHNEKHGIGLPQNGVFGELAPSQKDEALALLFENWGPFLEFPQTLWSFRVPRSFHAQLRVHRHWSCWSESHQLVEPREFYTQGDYYEPDTMSVVQTDAYRTAMSNAQDAYNGLLDQGLLPAIARNVLPMSINLGLTAGINLRALTQTVILRRCHIFQGTFWNPLLEQMRHELVTKVDPALEAIFKLQPCDFGSCISTVEQEQRVRGEDPHKPCPRYIELKKTDGKSNCCGDSCLGCLKNAEEKGFTVHRSLRF